MKVPGIRQRDATDCGACCLQAIAAAWRVAVPAARLRLDAGTDGRGTTALGLIEAARRLGFSARGVKGGLDDLPSVPLPAIAHCLIDGRRLHYVVLADWSPDSARVMDPAVGRLERWPRARFQAAWTGVLILLSPGDGFQPQDRTQPPWRRLWSLLQPHRGVLGQALAGAAASTVLGLAAPVGVQIIVDHVLPDGNRTLLHLVGLGLLAALGLRLALGVLQAFLSLRTAQQIDAALILAYYRHLLHLPQPFFDSMRVGEITSRVGDAVKIRNFLNGALLSLILHPLVLAGSLGAMFLWSWQLALLSLALLPAHAALYWLVNLRNRTCQRALTERTADLDSHLVESVAAQTLLRRHCLEAPATLRTEVRLVRLLRAAWHAAAAGIGAGAAGTLVTQAYQVGLLWLGTAVVLDAGGLTPGELMSCYTLAGYLAGPLTSLLGLNASIQEALVATDRLFEILDLEAEPDRGGIAFELRHAGGLRFESVSFHYAGRATALHEVRFHCPPGCITALVGPSGCGKSTALSLIQRLYAPAAGRILVGGIDLTHFRLASLRRHLGVVPQQPAFLSGTVLENLAPGDAAPDLERLLVLAREVGALPFIEQLPQGFLAPLAENGAGLSGGQRQQLALVRALYLDAPILLLDEPSSALDASAEATLVRLLRRQRDELGRTIVIATHSPALVAAADHVVTLDRGSVASVLTRPPPAPACEPGAHPLAPAAPPAAGP